MHKRDMLRLTVLGAAVAVAGTAWGAPPPAPAPKPPAKVMVFATSDEHGWLEPLTQKGTEAYQGGMAYFMGQLLTREGYRPKDALLLSVGDMWTGPYENTVLQGRPMVQVMNAMGYDAAAIGNHDFDFGQDVLARRAQEAGFPLLSANLYQKGTRKPPPYAKPFAIVEANGVKVGLVGLTTVDTVYTTDARNTAGLDFGPYLDALRVAVPAARAAGAQVIMVMSHADLAEMRPLAGALRALGVNAVLCGHRHQGKLEVDDGAAGAADDVIFCNPGPYARSYCRLDLTWDGGTYALQAQKSSIELVAGNVAHPTAPPHEGLMGVAAEARSQAQAKGAELLANVPAGLHRSEPIHTMGYLVVDAWLEALPYADFAFSNQGGFRQDIEGGPVLLRDLVGAMPFDNYLLVVELTGEQMKEVLENLQTLPAGMTVDVTVDESGKRTVLAMTDRKGQPVAKDRTYRVVINDFMYRGGDRYRFKEWDPDPEETAIHWREPVVRLLRTATKANKPVPLATTPRFRVRR